MGHGYCAKVRLEAKQSGRKGTLSKETTNDRVDQQVTYSFLCCNGIPRFLSNTAFPNPSQGQDYVASDEWLQHTEQAPNLLPGI